MLVNDNRVEILPAWDSTSHVGKDLSLFDLHETELQGIARKAGGFLQIERRIA